MYVLNGLSLFSGIGGIDIGLNQWVRTVCYCEIDPYCQCCLLSRISDGDLENAPIWDDIRTFNIPPAIREYIDIIHGGFPCQDISIAGHGKGLEGERSGLFYEIIRLAQEIRPTFVFLENVPAITTRGGVQVVTEFAEMGYDARWCCISGEEIGAPHKRARWFLLAHANSKPSGQTNSQSFAEQIERETWMGLTRPTRTIIPSIYWEINCSPIHCMDDGLSNGMDEAKALGNAVIPMQAKQAFQILMGLK